MIQKWWCLLRLQLADSFPSPKIPSLRCLRSNTTFSEVAYSIINWEEIIDYYLEKEKECRENNAPTCYIIWGDGVSRRQTIFELFGNLYPRPPVHLPGNEEERWKRKGVLRVCLAVNGPRKREGRPLSFVTGRAVENLLFRVQGGRGGGGPCVTHVHFNAITASSSVRGSKWPGRNFFLRFRVSALLRRENFNCASTNQPTNQPSRRPFPPLFLSLRRLTRREEAWCDGGMSSEEGDKDWKVAIDRIRSKILTLCICISIEGQFTFHIRSKEHIFGDVLPVYKNTQVFARISILWSVKICDVIRVCVYFDFSTFLKDK